MKSHAPVILLFACAGLFAGTLFLLLKDRFDRGDVYPPSSSLRSDPLGTMIFYESLQTLPGVWATRDHSAVNRLPEGKGTTYMQFSARAGDWDLLPVDAFRVIDRFLLEGGRLVITLAPGYAGWRARQERDGESKKEGEEKAPEKKKKKEERKEKEFVSLREKWGLSLEVIPSEGSGEYPVQNVAADGLPLELKWHGETILKDPSALWTVLYRSKEGPVMAEMKRGRGSVVVATDSYFVSNEAMVKDRQPAVLAWLVGSGRHIVFDEAHFGIMESPGIAALVRKYRLFGGVATLLVLAGLFIWKNSSTLVPRRSVGSGREDVIVGRNTTAGFVGLLRRNIPPDQVFDVCLQEWRKSFGRTVSAREKSAVEEIVRVEEERPVRGRDPVAAYQKIRDVLRHGPQNTSIQPVKKSWKTPA